MHRIVNLDLMSQYGSDAWKLSNNILQQILETARKQLIHLKYVLSLQFMFCIKRNSVLVLVNISRFYSMLDSWYFQWLETSLWYNLLTYRLNTSWCHSYIYNIEHIGHGQFVLEARGLELSQPKQLLLCSWLSMVATCCVVCTQFGTRSYFTDLTLLFGQQEVHYPGKVYRF